MFEIMLEKQPTVVSTTWLERKSSGNHGLKLPGGGS
jgi:hypothetical protein